MKKLIFSTLILILSSSIIVAQERMKTIGDSTKNDTTKITWGKKKIIIVDTDGSGENNEVNLDSTEKKRSQRYNHFAGIDFGVNGFLNAANSVDLQKDAEFMDLNYAKSISFALNFAEWYIPLVQEKIGISTGLGIEFNSYDLARDYTILSPNDTVFGVQDPTIDIDKNRFKTTMFNLPIMLETNIGKDAEHSFHLAAGAMLSARLGSKTKQIFEQGGKDYKVKNRNSYELNPFRVNAVARIGYGNFTAFAQYSLTALFEDNHGPEIFPFTVGISLVTFD